MRRCAVVALVAGCLDAPAYDGTMYKCVEQEICPPGFMCSGGVCLVDPQTNEGFARIPGTTYMRGCTDASECSDAPRTSVTVAAFVIMRFEVTQAEYARCTLPECHAPTDVPYDPANARAPVRGISWVAAFVYCASQGLRLPTEAEWELAARGVDDHPYPWNSAELRCDLAIHKDCPPNGPVDVDQLEAGKTDNGAIYHLAGNVREWVHDAYGQMYYVDGQINPNGPTTGNLNIHVIRGGSFASLPAELKVWNRDAKDGIQRDNTNATIGVRCADDAP